MKLQYAIPLAVCLICLIAMAGCSGGRFVTSSSSTEDNRMMSEEIRLQRVASSCAATPAALKGFWFVEEEKTIKHGKNAGCLVGVSLEFRRHGELRLGEGVYCPSSGWVGDSFGIGTYRVLSDKRSQVEINMEFPFKETVLGRLNCRDNRLHVRGRLFGRHGPFVFRRRSLTAPSEGERRW